ncbi:MAG: dephospho-CoA kinase [Rhizobiales bacterium]|nr:dephospho-CoA kinase [Hyphomicrobiales bacterium]
MLKIGLTGSIGMGKSTTSEMFKQYGIPIFDADAMVHILYQKDYQGYDAVKAICPEATTGDNVDRVILSAHILKHPDDLKKIEKAIHPLIREIENEFFSQTQKSGAHFIIFDIPLLFEMNVGHDMDKVIVVTTSPEIQKERVMQRQSMSIEKFEFILSKQMDDTEKRKKADYIVDTSDGIESAKQQVAKIVDQINLLET